MKLLRLSLCLWAAFVDAWRGRGLATNAVMTPGETSHGTASLDGTAAIATKNYLVVRGADDRHFKVPGAVTDVPLGILLNDELGTTEVDAVKKNIALFGLWPDTLPGVAAAAIAVDAWVVPDLATPGRVKALPATPGTYWAVGKSRFTVANAGDPVSIVHCTPFQVEVGAGGKVIFFGTHTWAGGAATTDAKAIAGLLSTDVVTATLRARGASETLVLAVPTADTLTFTLSANGANGSTKIDYAVHRAVGS